MHPQDFYIKTRASAGVRVELVDPAGNREWMRVRSIAADEFRRAADQVMREAIGALELDRKGRLRKSRAFLAASLISEWSLPMQSDAEKAALLESNPRLRRQIERIAENHALHFGVAQ